MSKVPRIIVFAFFILFALLFAFTDVIFLCSYIPFAMTPVTQGGATDTQVVSIVILSLILIVGYGISIRAAIKTLK
jgi:hypothetical protein